MKKQWLLLAAAALLSWNAGAEEIKSGPTLPEVMRAANAEKAKSLNSVSLIFEAEGGGMPLSRIVFNLSGKDKFRMDLISAGNVCTICRDGVKYWGFETGKGVYELSEADVNDLACDLVICPFNTFKDNIFPPLVPNGEGVSGDKECRIYDAFMPNDKDYSLSIWQDKATKSPVLVKINNHGARFHVSYLEFQDYNGLRLPSRINSAGKNGVMRFKLLAVEQNPELKAELFAPADPSKNIIVVTAQRTLDEAVKAKAAADAAAKEVKAVKAQAEAKAAAKAKADSPEAKRAKIEKEIIRTKSNIQKLDILIAEREKSLATLEKVAFTSVDKAADVAAKAPAGGNSSWGWGYYRWHRRSSGSAHTQRKISKQLMNASKKAAEEYENVNRELTDLKLKRVDYQTYLEKLNASLK